MRIILASRSPRRKELLKLITPEFEIMSEDVNERAIEARVLSGGGDAQKVQRELARSKAWAVFDKLPVTDKNECVIIGADTCVVCDDAILGKPADKDDARNMLQRLCGKQHEVITGVCVKAASFEETFTEVTKVRFGDLDSFQSDLIESYINTDEPYDKAGAYGIQNGGALLVETVEGDCFNVVGLPVRRLSKILGHLH